MDALQKANAPSNTPAGLLGVGSRIARIQLTTAQGGMAHFISQGGELSTVDGADLSSVSPITLSAADSEALMQVLATLAGKHLGDLGTAAPPWADVRTALLDGTSIWQTTNGAHGSSSSKIVATVECKRVVAPGAKPTCTVTPEPGL